MALGSLKGGGAGGLEWPKGGNGDLSYFKLPPNLSRIEYPLIQWLDLMRHNQKCIDNVDIERTETNLNKSLLIEGCLAKQLKRRINIIWIYLKRHTLAVFVHEHYESNTGLI